MLIDSDMKQVKKGKRGDQKKSQPSSKPLANMKSRIHQEQSPYISKEVVADLRSHFRRRSNRSLNTQSSGNLHALKSSRNIVSNSNAVKLPQNQNSKKDVVLSVAATPKMLYGEALSR